MRSVDIVFFAALFSNCVHANELFFGFASSTPISVFQLIKTTGADGFVVDAMHFQSAASAEPTTLALLGIGLAGLGSTRRKTRKGVA